MNRRGINVEEINRRKNNKKNINSWVYLMNQDQIEAIFNKFEFACISFYTS